MAIRKAVVADQVAMAKLAATAFFNDELFVLIHPYRHEFPDDMHLYWLANIQRSWPYSFNHYLVSTVQDALDGQEKIVAWAQWTRKGRQTQEIRASIPKPEINLPTNRAADPTKEKVLEQAYELVGHVEWSGPRAECWDIAWLACSPAHQGQGHGKALMQFGIEQARREGVATSVCASYGMDKFYNRLGYVVPSGKLSAGLTNPLGAMLGLQIWWREDQEKA